ncbi:hypothetical protein BU26DRAFT_558198 [Trematosphaeria pertusa]|uniref:Uncharacterized protein n=1 Tax=Trematosphaeria pertusa TaxID=390896 RepID=A0A6A6J2H1_9PLEO|nr:uncharacterized protein BU26DRAFT_558198 [Trematosphaeria pertusa]KAF2256758.1 hypothetical protein BU26DRAFT_558198 [Trematosphaeria pertusa]
MNSKGKPHSPEEPDREPPHKPSTHVKISDKAPEIHEIPPSMQTWTGEEPPKDPSKTALDWSARQMFGAEQGMVKRYDELKEETGVKENGTEKEAQGEPENDTSDSRKKDSPTGEY